MSELKEQQIYASFFLGDFEYALSVSYVQEVVNPPESYNNVPLAPHYLKGLFNLRGAVIPVIDMRALLGLDKTTSSHKVAIVEYSGSCIGLLFDQTSEIFRSDDSEKSNIGSSHTSGILSGVFKRDKGRKVTQIIDVAKLFKLQNIGADTNLAHLGRGLNRRRGQRSQCISFVVGTAKCALPIAGIQEILKIDQLNESALAVGHCLGSIDLRGNIVPIVDFTALLKYREVNREDTPSDRRVIVMKLDKEFFGLMVDSIDSIISYYPDDLVAFPLVNQAETNMFKGCITGHGETDILLLEDKQILAIPEIVETTRGHNQIYRSQEEENKAKKSKGGARKTYITFTIDNSFAVEINDVKEIIDYPESLLQLHGKKHHICGVLNLRGDLVTIIDARSMYSYASQKEDKASQKVLVFNRQGVHFGLVVDSVESIVAFAENDKINLPQIMYRNSGNNISEDLSEAIEVTDTHGHTRNLLILNSDSVATRASKAIAA